MDPTLETHRAAALTTLASAVSATRGLYLTDLFGQELLYIAQALEARAYLAAPGQPLDAYPLIRWACGPDQVAADPASVAQIWAAKALAWGNVGGQIDHIRRAAEAGIQRADTSAEIDAALWAATAALDAVRP